MNQETNQSTNQSPNFDTEAIIKSKTRVKYKETSKLPSGVAKLLER